MKDFENMNIRFYLYDIVETAYGEELKPIEVDEAAFLKAKGEIKYERLSELWDGNGNEITLTKSNGHW